MEGQPERRVAEGCANDNEVEVESRRIPYSKQHKGKIEGGLKQKTMWPWGLGKIGRRKSIPYSVHTIHRMMVLVMSCTNMAVSGVALSFCNIRVGRRERVFGITGSFEIGLKSLSHAYYAISKPDWRLASEV